MSGQLGVEPPQLRYYVSRAPRLSPAAATLFTAVGVGAFTAVLLTVSDHVAFAVSATVVAAFLLSSEFARLAFVVEGALLTLHSGINGVTDAKAAYAAGLALSVATILVRLPRRHARARDPIGLLVPGSIAVVAVLLVSALVANSQGVALNAWFRDATSYALIAVVPLFVWDIGQERFASWLSAVLAAAGAATACAFVLEWLGRRHAISGGPDRLLLPSLLLPAAATCYGLALVASARASQRWWLAFVVLVVPAMFITGTRSALIVFVGALPVVLWLSRDRQHTRRVAIIGLVSCAATAAVVMSLAFALPPSNSSALGRVASRLRELPQLVVKPASDQSFGLRRGQWRVAWEAFKAHPFIGVGPGHVFTSPYPYGAEQFRRSYSLDTPLALPAKFGIVGLVGFFLLGLSWWRFLAHFLRARSVAAIAMAAFGAVAILYVPLGVPLEDKGFTIGVLLLAALVVAEESSRRLPPVIVTRGWRGATQAPFTKARTSELAGAVEAQPTHPTDSPADLADASGPTGLLWDYEVRGVLFTIAGVLAGAAIVAGVWAWRGTAGDNRTPTGSTATLAPSASRGRSAIASAAEAAASEKRIAAAYVRVWTFFSCGHCKFELQRITTDLWEFDIGTAAGPACYMLNTTRFRWSATRVQSGVARLSCP